MSWKKEIAGEGGETEDDTGNYEKYRKRRETEAIPHEIAVDEEKKYRPEAM